MRHQWTDGWTGFPKRFAQRSGRLATFLCPTSPSTFLNDGRGLWQIKYESILLYSIATYIQHHLVCVYSRAGNIGDIKFPYIV